MLRRFAWLGLLLGTKLWHLSPPHAEPPDEFGCSANHKDCSSDWNRCMRREGGSSHMCEQQQGEVVVVPPAWWHATCNQPVSFGSAGRYTLGIGGQDKCGTIPFNHRDCKLVLPPPERLLNKQQETNLCPDAKMAVRCHGTLGLDMARADNEVLLQPDAQIVRMIETL